MKKEYVPVYKIKFTKYELKIVIEALNVRRLKYKERGIHDLVACDLILYLLDIIEA